MQSNTSNQTAPISGWLSIILWIGVAGVTTYSLITQFYTLFFQIPYTFITGYYVARIISGLIMICITTRIIWAFYKVREDAIPLFLFYLLSIGIGGFLWLYWYFAGASWTFAARAVLGFVTAGLGFAYLKNSKQIQNRFDGVKRRLFPFDIILITLYFGGLIGNIIFFTTLKNNSIRMMDKKFVIESAMKETRIQSDNIYISYPKTTLENDTLVFYIQFKIDNIEKTYTNSVKLLSKQIALRDIAMIDENIEVWDQCIDDDIIISFRHLDSNNKVFYSFNITPQEYKWARDIGHNFHCDKETWDAILTQTKGELPQTILDNFKIINLFADVDSRKLELIIQMPTDEKALEMDSEALLQYLTNNRDELINLPIIILAIIDRTDISIKFIRPNGEVHATIMLPHETFQFP